MGRKISIDLGNVQKTLFLPLWGRAIESKKDRPQIIDRTAMEILDKVDFDFSEIAKNIDELSQIAWIRRSQIVDRTVKQFLSRHPRATIVNVGCGLDTTYERVDNSSLFWYDLDLPDVIELRRKFIPEWERRKYISASFLEKGWLDKIRVVDGVFFIAAGVFYYFEENEARDFLVRIAEHFPGCEALFDVSSPTGVRVANKKVIQSSGLDEKSYLKWGLESPKKLQSWDRRFEKLETHFYFRTLKYPMSLRNFLMGQFSDYLKIQYMIHLKMAE